MILNSTRLFCSLPSSLSLSARGLPSPNPRATNLLEEISSRCTKKVLTDSARFWESLLLYEEDPIESVCPSMFI